MSEVAAQKPPVRQLRGTLVISAVSVIAASYVLYKLVQSLALDDFWAYLGFSPLGAISQVDKRLQSLRLRRLGFGEATVADVQGTYSPARLLIYGVFVVIAAMELFGFYIGFMAVWRLGLHFRAIVFVVYITNPAALGLLLLACGVWIGARATRYSWVIIAVTAIAARLGLMAVDSLLLKQNVFARFLDLPASEIRYQIVATVLLPIILGLVGVWYGRRVRLDRHLGTRLRSLPKERREDWVYRIDADARRHVESAMAVRKDADSDHYVRNEARGESREKEATREGSK
jgi:hypothetical protein